MGAFSNMVSVYDESTGQYHYYRVNGQPGRAWTMTGNMVGTPIQDALPSLPLRAQRVGQGAQPLGTIVQGQPDWKEHAVKWGGIALGVYVLGRLSGIIPPFRRRSA